MKRILVLMLLVTAAFSQTRSRLADYALVLEDPPVAEKAQSRVGLKSSEAQAHLAKVRGAQGLALAELGRRKVRVSSTAQILVNAIFVRVAPEDAAALRAIPGVKWIQYLPPAKPMLNAALDLVGVPAAWAAIGGSANAGAGVRIGIIDTGIDQNHPGFQDSNLKPPSGFPVGDSAYTNNKVIVARSYVSMLNDAAHPEFSTPDDFSARDRQGHGTAIAMIAAGVQNTGPLGTITGVAPKAFLGNYKVFGSPGVNEFTLFPLWQKALEDAFTDGMDIVTLSIGEGDPAIVGPIDIGVGVCNDEICDVRSQAVESATKLGMLVVTAAGNGGNIGLKFPTQNSLNTPGVAPGGVTVGASMNRHVLYQTLRVNGSSLGNLRALFGDGPRVGSPLTARVKDVAQLANDGLACTALPAGLLTGGFALIQRGTCVFADKINFAQAAGAIGVIIYNVDGNQDIFQRLFVQNTGIPAALISNDDGKALKVYLGANPTGTITLDPAILAGDNPLVNTVAPFSSRGPSIGNVAAIRDFALKPELVAPGVDIYTATQKFDPNSDAYNATGYTRVSGTSYSVAFVAGVAAMAKANNPKLKAPGLKSAVVNTAKADLQGDVHVTDAGAGRLNAVDAIAVTATLDPAAISFGKFSGTAIDRNFTLTNLSGATAQFTLAVRPLVNDSNVQVTLSDTTVSVPGQQSKQIAVSLRGRPPNSGSYEGFIDVTGVGAAAGPTLHLPYLYLAGIGVPYNIFPMNNGSFTGATSDTGWVIGFRMVDPFGLPAVGVPVQFRIQAGGGKIEAGDLATDALGYAKAFVDLGPQQGDQIFIATAGAYTQEFDGFARRLPAIGSGGVVNAAPPFKVGPGLGAGSYISIFGSDLSDTTLRETTTSLPVSLGLVSVSFDGGGKSLAGHPYFVSPGQINVQIPWEYQGQSSVTMKVTLYGYLSSATYTVPLSTYSPGIFAVTDSGGATPISSAKRGDVIVLYANGLGPVDTPQASGEPASATKLVGTQTVPTVTIGGAAATVMFSGLTPNLVGLYQVNVKVPDDAPTGAQTLKLSIGGADVSLNLTVQ